jgi:deoxyribonuclease V
MVHESPKMGHEARAEGHVLRVRSLHPWHVDYASALRIQERLRGQIVRRGGPKNVRLIAGADVSYDKSDDRFYSAVIVMSFPQLDIIEQVTVTGVATFPYIPGMLTFREGPIMLDAFHRLKHISDLVIFDGQGVAHPREFGLASHLGLLLGLPSIGCAKTRLCGECAEPAANASSCAPLTYEGKRVGMVVRTRARVKPVFVSAGHRISLARAVGWVLKSCRGFRLPEPTRQAHIMVNKLRILSQEPRIMSRKGG